MAAPSKRKHRPAKTAGARKRARGYDGQHLCGEHGGTCRDRISELPDHLLAVILGHLDTRSSAATSVLSRRWRHVWKSVPRLRFSHHDAMQPTQLCRFLRAHKYAFVRPSLCRWRRRVRVSDDRLSRLIDRYSARIFLRSLTGFLRASRNNSENSNCTRITSLVLNCFMKDHYARLIDQLVKFAVCHGVEDLDLTTYAEDYSTGSQTAKYQFPLSLFSGDSGSSLMELKLGECTLSIPVGYEGFKYLMKLKLEECTLSIPVGFEGFKSLVELSFYRMHISEAMIQTLLDNCSKLRSLHLDNCWGVTNLRIASQGLELRDLVVNSCLPITYIELGAPKLQRFGYRGQCITMLFGSAVTIEHAWLNYNDRNDGDSIKYIIGNLPVDFPKLTSVNIVLYTYKLKNPITPGGRPTIFRSLQSLTLQVIMHANDDLAWVTMLLDAAPVLEIFQIQVSADEKRDHPGGIFWEPGDFEHRRLRQVKMYHFRTGRSVMALVKLLLSRAPLLHTMTFFHGFFDSRQDWTYDYLDPDEDASRKRQAAIQERLAEWNTFGASLEFVP
ncbi:hypothetical protein ACP70R_036947 [Stipagrostis hirtigluma subsp. patula]